MLWSYSQYQVISSVLANVLLLDNVEEQNRNNEMPKGTRLGKTAFMKILKNKFVSSLSLFVRNSDARESSVMWR